MKLSRKDWEYLSSREMEILVDRIFYHYRKTGFPYYPTDTDFRLREFHKFINFDTGKLIQNNVIGQTMHGLSLAWSYFPHAWTIRCGNMMSPMDAFLDDDIFRKVILKRLKIGTYMSDSGIRKMLKIYTGVQAVSNFRPTAARAIYDMFVGQNDRAGNVWDMCGGFGGRLLGAMGSKRVSKYVATEPSTKTYEGLCNMVSDFVIYNKYEIWKMGAEDFQRKEYFDLCFSSPPYFDCEKYSDEPTQSYIKYSTPKEWFDGFLMRMIENCHISLCSGARLILNVADVRTYPNLVNDCRKNIPKVGFVYEGEMKYMLSKMMKRGFKYEPVLIYRKV